MLSIGIISQLYMFKVLTDLYNSYYLWYLTDKNELKDLILTVLQ